MRRPALGMTLTFVTGNPNKLRELSQMIGSSITVRSEAIDLPEMQGWP